MLEIYTDGSSLHNGKPNCVGGWSAIFYLNGKMFIRYGHLKAQSSNNRGEVSGILYTINMLHQKKEWDLQIYSDSQYAVKSINEWRHKWKRNNYEGIKNPDLLVPLFNLWDMHGKAKIDWVKGHADTKGNQVADIWAGRGMRNIIQNYSNDTEDVRFVSEEDFWRQLSK